MHPHGVLQACIYFEGELVPIGYLNFYNDMGRIDYLTYVPLKDGCKDVVLLPGIYGVGASYWQDVCTGNSGCILKERFELVIEDGDVIKKDFEVFRPE